MTDIVRTTTTSLAGLLDTLEGAATVLAPVDDPAGRLASRLAVAFDADMAVAGELDAAVDSTGADVLVVAGSEDSRPDVDELLDALLGRHPRLRIVELRPDGSCQVARRRRRWPGWTADASVA